ncbi:DUF4810 domain-containing protein [Hahella sp. CCB-MM4]|uniref:DUF4810 domain-containing protein n=1 Tax=Hahella sp. (strain CCB-MM4) TaxID=1926491 RepID=UPI000B9BCF69|nr:DUF4810 domain-containing protein [Hahella sp. CCB-MM4]OZG72931.1 DUF4810 domain-containing protein [Hahella sp. CCB-MM4]
MNAVHIKASAVIVLLLLSGCATQKPLYYWGDYEPVIYDMYNNPGEADTSAQIEKLTATIQRAQSQDMQVPPGLYAHLGMIYAEDGSPELAVEALNEEKALYPESATFIDGMLERARKGAKQ